MLAWLGCCLAHLSYALRTACLASSCFMFATKTLPDAVRTRTTAIRWTRYYTPVSVGPSGQTLRAVREHVLREDANVLADRAKSGYAPSDCSPSARRMPP